MALMFDAITLGGDLHTGMSFPVILHDPDAPLQPLPTIMVVSSRVQTLRVSSYPSDTPVLSIRNPLLPHILNNAALEKHYFHVPSAGADPDLRHVSSKSLRALR